MYWNAGPFNGTDYDVKRLIETWDVLKCKFYKSGTGQDMINRNMRCIEITDTWTICGWYLRLIETWDVLKSIRADTVTVEG